MKTFSGVLLSAAWSWDGRETVKNSFYDFYSFSSLSRLGSGPGFRLSALDTSMMKHSRRTQSIKGDKTEGLKGSLAVINLYEFFLRNFSSRLRSNKAFEEQNSRWAGAKTAPGRRNFPFRSESSKKTFSKADVYLAPTPGSNLIWVNDYFVSLSSPLRLVTSSIC